MGSNKFEWAIYTNPETGETEEVKYSDMNKDEYKSKYRGNLSCINKCKAKIKFTQKTNGRVFFSNSSKQGDKHDEGCQFGVQYKGRNGKNKLIAYYKNLNVSKEDIKNSIKNKISTLKRKYNGEDRYKEQTYTNEIDKIGEKGVSEENVSNNPSVENDSSVGRKKIMSLDANHLGKDSVGVVKCVYGKAKSAEIKYKDGEYYGYINLKNEDYNVAAYCPKAFYSQENGINEEEFVNLFKILKDNMDQNYNKKFIVVCYGEIRKKKKENNGLNIQILDSDYLTINEMTVKEILRTKKIKNIDYDII